jgi:hypothetical protein
MPEGLDPIETGKELHNTARRRIDRPGTATVMAVPVTVIPGSYRSARPSCWHS